MDESGDEAPRGRSPHLRAQRQGGMGKRATTLGRVEEKATETPRRARTQLEQKATLREVRPQRAWMVTGHHRRWAEGPLYTTKHGKKAGLAASRVVKSQNILSWRQCVSTAPTVPSILWFVKSGNSYSSVLVIYYDPSSSKAGLSWTGTFFSPFVFLLYWEISCFTFQLLYWIFSFCSHTFNFRTDSCSLTVPFENHGLPVW